MIVPLLVREEKTHHSGGIKEVLLTMHEGKKYPICKDLYKMPSEPNLLSKASRPFAIIVSSPKVMT